MFQPFISFYLSIFTQSIRIFGYRLARTRVECNESIKIDSIDVQFSGGGGLLAERKRTAISRNRKSRQKTSKKSFMGAKRKILLHVKHINCERNRMLLLESVKFAVFSRHAKRASRIKGGRGGRNKDGISATVRENTKEKEIDE